MQLSGTSSTYQWTALGQGKGMTGANIFVVYPSENGTNMTVSPRLGNGHSEPQFNADAKVTVLPGSGTMGGKS